MTFIFEDAVRLPSADAVRDTRQRRQIGGVRSATVSHESYGPDLLVVFHFLAPPAYTGRNSSTREEVRYWSIAVCFLGLLQCFKT